MIESVTMRRNAAFSLLELMLCMAILSIVIALIPSAIEFQRDSAAARQASELSLILQHARSVALGRRKAVTVCPMLADRACGSNWNAPIQSFIDTNGDRRLDEQEELLYKLEPLKGLDINWRGMGSHRQIYFSGQGFTVISNGRLTICSGGTPLRELVINRQGRIRISAQPAHRC